MKYFTISIIQLFAILFYANAQNNSACLVKYKDLKSKVILGTFNHWFYPDQLIASHEPNYRAINMRGFPVLINNVMTTQTDTIKYNKEFNEFVSDSEAGKKNRPERVTVKYYKSDISKTSLSSGTSKNNYIIIDTLEKMNNWEILNDTQNFMGYKCQKAMISYKQDNYYAWFTTQLPYNAGPDGFRGLPGLILKVSNTYGNIGYEATEIQTPYKGVIPKFNNIGETISQKEWIVISNESRKKAMESMNSLMEGLKTPEGKESFINQYKKQAELQKP